MNFYSYARKFTSNKKQIMAYKKFSLIFGFTLWLIATLVFRFAENNFFFIDNFIVISSLYIGTIPVLYLFVKWVFNKFQLTNTQMKESVILMSIPGMVLDTFAIKFYYLVFPTLSKDEAIILGSWVIWAYVVVLLIGLLSKKEIDA